MTLHRSLPLILVLAILPLWPALAQFGGTPGSPGMGTPGMFPFGVAPPQQGPPPACQQLLTLRDQTQKHGAALQAASQKKATPDEICPLFQAFLAAEAKMIEGLEENSATCGLPAQTISQVKSAHDKATQMGNQVCDPRSRRPWCFNTLVPGLSCRLSAVTEGSRLVIAGINRLLT